MGKLKVIRVEPLDLPSEIVWKISGLYHIPLKDFNLYMSEKEDKMYVNKSVPEKDIEKFLWAATFPGRYIIEDDTEIGEFMDYVCEAYGYAAYDSLHSYHWGKVRKKDEQRAKDQMKEILPLIEEITKSENPPVHYDEYLLYEAYKRGKESKSTASASKVSYGDIYIFYLGYLMGTGKVNVAEMPDRGGAKQ